MCGIYRGYRSSPPLMRARAYVRLTTANWRAHLNGCSWCRFIEPREAGRCMEGESLLHSLGLAHESLVFESFPFLYECDCLDDEQSRGLDLSYTI